MRFPILVAALLASAVSLSASDYYSFTNVKRLRTPVWRESSFKEYLIETSTCLHLTIGEDVTVKWDGYSGTAIWDDNSNL
jgi:hypothetical protein